MTSRGRRASRRYLSLLLVATIGWAGSVAAAEGCCKVVSVDAEAGIVTAEITANGETYRFEVGNAWLLERLVPGTAFGPDYVAGVDVPPEALDTAWGDDWPDLAMGAMTAVGEAAIVGAVAEVLELAPGIVLDSISLTRVGNAVELKYRVTDNADSDYVLQDSGFGVGEANRQALSLIELLDLVNAKRYAVGWANRRCLCSDQDQYGPLLTVPVGQSKVFWAHFAAPPLDLATISVQFPGIPPVHGVAIGG